MTDNIFDAGLAETMNARLKAGWYRDNFMVVFGMPKAGSSVFHSCIRIIQEDLNWPDNSRPTGPIPNQYGSIGMDHLRSFVNGGTSKVHSIPDECTLDFLKTIGCRYFVAVRNPMDQMIAMFHHLRRMLIIDKTTGGFYLDEPSKIFYLDYLADDDFLVNQLLENGYFHSIVGWFALWHHRRDPARSLIYRYEDWVTKGQEVFDPAARLMYGRNLTDIEREKINLFIATGGRNNVALGTQVYRKGWTGEIGIWEKFKNDDVLKFLREYFHALKNDEYRSCIFEYYPELSDL